MPFSENSTFRFSKIRKLLNEAGEINDGKEKEPLTRLQNEVDKLEREIERANQSSARQRKLLEELFLQMDEIIYVLSEEDSALHFSFISPQVNEILGISQSDFYRNYKIWEKLIHPEDLPNYKKALQLTLQGNHEISCEYRMKQSINGHYLRMRDKLWSKIQDNNTIQVFGCARRQEKNDFVDDQLKSIKSIDEFYQKANEINTIDEIISLLLNSINAIEKIETIRVYDFEESNSELKLRMENWNNNFPNKITELAGNLNKYAPILKEGSRYHKIVFQNKPHFASETDDIVELLKDHTANKHVRAIAGWVKNLLNIHTYAILPLVYKSEIFGLLNISFNSEISREKRDTILDMVNRGSRALSRIKKQNDLEAQMRMGENILNVLPVDIALFDIKHKYLFVNPSAVKSKETREWLIGKDDFDYARYKNLNYDIAETRRAYFFKAVSSRKEVGWIDEYDNSGHDKKYLLRKFYPCIEDNVVTYVIGYGIDISHYKSIEKEKEQLLKDLGNRVNELMQYNRIVSHNLRAPVASIMGLCDLLNHNLPQDDKKEIIESISITIHSMDQVLRDLNQVLSTKLTLDKQIEEVDLLEIIHEVKNNLSVLIQESSVVINIDIEADVRNFRSIKSYIHSIIYNLVSNSIKYRKAETDLVVSIKAQLINEDVEISVSDNGMGIDMKLYANQIFGLYQKFHSHKGGQGLGLHLSQAQAESLGGKLSVESELNKGSTFRLIVPSNKILAVE